MKRPQKYRYLKGASSLDIHTNLLNYYRDLEHYVDYIEIELNKMKEKIEKTEQK